MGGGEGESEMAEKEWGKREEKYSMERTGDTRVVLVHFFVYMYSLCSCFLAFFFFLPFFCFFCCPDYVFFSIRKRVRNTKMFLVLRLMFWCLWWKRRCCLRVVN